MGFSLDEYAKKKRLNEESSTSNSVASSSSTKKSGFSLDDYGAARYGNTSRVTGEIPQKISSKTTLPKGVTSTKRVAKSYENEAEDMNFFERAWNSLKKAVKGGAEQTAGSNTNAMVTAYEMGQNRRTNDNTENLEYAKNQLERSKRAYAEDVAAGIVEEGDLGYQDEINKWQSQVDAYEKILGENIQEKATEESYKVADTISQKGAEDVQMAKDYAPLGIVGDIASEAVASTTQSLIDGAVNILIGGQTMVPFAFRAFGGATQQARQEQVEKNGSYDLNKTVWYGAASAAKEVFTEKMFNIALPQSKIYGGGMLDDKLEQVISKVSGKFLKTEAGQKIFTTIMSSALSEGLEEFIGDWMEKEFPRIYNGDVDSISETLYNSLYDFAVGATSGIFGTPIQIAQIISEDQEEKAKNNAKSWTDSEDAEEAFSQAENGETQTVEDALRSAAMKQDDAISPDNVTQAKQTAQDTFANENARSFEQSQQNTQQSEKVSETADFESQSKEAQNLKSNAEINKEMVKNYASKLDKTGEKLLNESYDGTTDAADFVNEFTQYYNTGLNGSNKARKIVRSVLTSQQREAAFKAGIADRVVSQKISTSNNSNSGFDYSSAPKGFSKESAKTIDTLAKRLGVNVVFGDSGVNENGSYNTKTRTITLNPSTKNAVMSVVKHEVTHRMQELAPKQYQEFKDYVTEYYRAIDKLEPMVSKYMDAYREVDSKFSRNDAIDEIVSDFTAELFQNDEAFAKLVNTNRTLAQKIHDILADIINSIKSILGKAEISELNEFEKKWRDLLEASTKESEKLQSADSMQSETMRYSLKSMSVDIEEGKMKSDLIKQGVFTEDEANDFFENVNKLMDMITKKAFLDLHEEYDKTDRPFKPWKKNSDDLYKMSLDYSTLCKKRLVTGLIIDRLNEKQGKSLSATTQYAIRQKLSELQSDYKKLEIACAMCYVETARLKAPEQINRFLENKKSIATDYFAKKDTAFKKACDAKAKKKYGVSQDTGMQSIQGKYGKDINDKVYAEARRLRQGYKLSDYQKSVIEKLENTDNTKFLSAAGLTVLAQNEPVVYDIYYSYVRNSTKSKAIETDVPYYYGDSKGRGAVSNKLIKQLNQVCGMRSQSWSDFQLFHLLDNITAICEMSARHSKMHAFTKVKDFVYVNGSTGMMINMSLIPEGQTGLSSRGKLVFSSIEGMDIKDIEELRELFPSTAGSIAIGISDEHIIALLNDDRIDMVIPYHKSAISEDVARIAGINKWTDYSKYQSSINYETGKNANGPAFSTWLDLSLYDLSKPGVEVMQDMANKYIEECHKMGVSPVFEKFANEDNYWKLIIGRKMIDQSTGKIIEQQEVKPNFNWDKLFNIVKKAQDPKTDQMVEELTDIISAAIESGEIDAIREHRASDEFAKLTKQILKDNGFKSEILKDTDAFLADDGKRYSLKTGYENVPDSLMGFASDSSRNKSFNEQKYPYILSVSVSVDGGETFFDDEIKGMNKNHALERAKRNWPGAIIKENEISSNMKSDNPLEGQITFDDIMKAVPKANEGMDELFNLMADIESGARAFRSYYFKELYEKYPKVDFLRRFALHDPEVLDDFTDIVSTLNKKQVSDLLWYPIENRRGYWTQNNRKAVTQYKKVLKNRLNEILAAEGKKVGRNLGIKTGAATLEDVKYWFNQLNSDEDVAKLAEKVFDFIDEHKYLALDIKFRTLKMTDYHGGTGGEQLGDKVRYNTAYFNDEFVSDQKKASTLLHELIHSCTAYALQATSTPGSITRYQPSEYMIAACDTIRNIYNEILHTDIIKDDSGQVMYGMKNEYEMLAELSNPEFRAKLKEKNILHRLMDAIKRLFGIDTVNAFDAVSAAFDSLLYNFDGSGTLIIDAIRNQRNYTNMSESRYSLQSAAEYQKEVNRLERQNEALRNTSARLSNEITSNTKITDADAGKIADALLAEYPATMSRKELSSKILEIYRSYANAKDVNQAYEDLRKSVTELAEKLVNDSGVITNPNYEMYSDLRKTLKEKLKSGKKIADVTYQDLMEEYPEFFSTENITDEDAYIEMKGVYENLTDKMISNPFKGDEEMVSEYAANEIMALIFDSQVNTFAGRMNEKINAGKKAKAEAVAKQKANDKARLDKIIKENKEKREALIQQMNEKSDERIQKLMDKYRAKTEAGRERQSAKVLRDKILRHSKALSDKLLKATDKKHIPQELQGAVAELLKSINLESNNHKATKRTDAARALKEAYEKILKTETLTLDPDLMDNISLIADMGDTPIGQLSVDQLETMWRVIKATEASISSQNKAFAESKYQTVSEIAEAFRRDNAGKNRDTYNGVKGWLDKVVNMDSLTPQAFFHRLGEAGEDMFRMMRKAQDRHITLINEFKEHITKITEGLDINKLEKEKHTFNLTDGTIELTTAQIMSLYELYKRPQAQEHIFTGGIRAGQIDGSKQKGNAIPLHISPGELAKITSVLTDDQKKAADSLQKYLATDIAEYGNEASMQVYGYKKFGEIHYFPIKVDSNQTVSDISNTDKPMATIASMGSAKALTPHANNAVIIDSIFDVVSSNANDMAKYSSWLGTMETINKVRNFKFSDGNRTKSYIEGALGKSGNEYFFNLLNDINHSGSTDSSPLSKLTGSYKAAAVGANLRVIVQQPTAALRALSLIDARYLNKGIMKKADFEKVKKYAPIAIWKDWGYFDINTGRTMKSVMFDSDKRLDRINNALMQGASMADSVTWAKIWNACEYEISDTTDLKQGSEEYYQAVAERFNEVIDKTQVVDGVLQRSGIMRSKNEVNKMATSFMGEPTKTLNMVTTALYDLKNAKTREQRSNASKMFNRTMFALVASFVANAIAQSLVDAMRDDDDDEEYWEKFLSAFMGIEGDDTTFESVATSNFVSNFDPFGYIPYLKDMESLIEGYEVRRLDMEAARSAINSAKYFIKALNKEGKYTVEYATINMIAECSRLWGIPVANIKKDVLGIIYTTLQAVDRPDIRKKIDKAIYRK